MSFNAGAPGVRDAMQSVAAGETAWRAALDGFSVPTPLPGDIGTSATPRSGRYAEAQRAVPEPAAEALVRLGQARGVPISAFVEAAWALVLGRASGEGDVLFGVASG